MRVIGSSPSWVHLATFLVGLTGCGASDETGETDTTGGDTQPAVDDTADDTVDDTGDDTGEDSAEPEELPTLVINEFMAENSVSWTPDGLSYPDWIELMNPGDETVALDGLTITDALDEPDKYALPDGLEVEPGGYLVLAASGVSSPEGIELPFRLSAGGEQIGLFTASGVPIDQIAFGEQEADVSAARAVDGLQGSDWVYLPGGTPGTANASE